MTDKAKWICPYCEKPLPDERAACCGEVGHGVLQSSSGGAPVKQMDPYERAVRLAEEWQKNDETRKFLVSIIELAEQIGGFDHETRWKP